MTCLKNMVPAHSLACRRVPFGPVAGSHRRRSGRRHEMSMMLPSGWRRANALRSPGLFRCSAWYPGTSRAHARDPWRQRL